MLQQLLLTRAHGGQGGLATERSAGPALALANLRSMLRRAKALGALMTPMSKYGSVAEEVAIGGGCRPRSHVPPPPRSWRPRVPRDIAMPPLAGHIDRVCSVAVSATMDCLEPSRPPLPPHQSSDRVEYARIECSVVSAWGLA